MTSPNLTFREDSFENSFLEGVVTDKETLLQDVSDDPAHRYRQVALQRSIKSTISNFQEEGIPNSLRIFQSGCKKCFDFLIRNPLFIHLMVAAAYSVLYFVTIYHPWRVQYIHNTIYTPAADAISWEAETLDVRINKTFNIYNGDPSPEVDDAWGALFHHANIRVSQEEIKSLGRPSIQLADGSGDYFGSLDVYHQLHCLKYIRQYIHQDYYTLGKTNVPSKEHVNHCIEMLRQVIMCKGDTALMTYEWLPNFPGPWPNFGIEHECVNWEMIDNWSKERSIDIYDPAFLQHPKFGFSYAHLKGLLSSNNTHE